MPRSTPEKASPSGKAGKNQTPAEAALQERLRNQHLGVDFQFGQRARGYVVDVFCPDARLVIEIDGPSDDVAAAVKRDGLLEDKGLSVLHLSADMTVDAMVERIDRKLHYLQVARHYPERPAPADATGTAA